MDNDSLKRGMEIWQQMTDGRGEELRERWAQLHPDLAEMIVGFVGGDVWTRPGLDLRTRSLITIAATTALGRTNALELNIRMALNNGATREEVCETLLHMAAYAGFPAAWDAFVVASKVFGDCEQTK